MDLSHDEKIDPIIELAEKGMRDTLKSVKFRAACLKLSVTAIEIKLLIMTKCIYHDR